MLADQDLACASSSVDQPAFARSMLSQSGARHVIGGCLTHGARDVHGKQQDCQQIPPSQHHHVGFAPQLRLCVGVALDPC